MPLYRFAISKGLTTEDQRAEISRETVRVHCGVTGAPPSFVHAFFNELDPAQLPAGKSAFVLGTIRWGRTDQQKAEIVADLGSSVARIIDCDPNEVEVMTVDVPSKWTMEGGDVLPEPGEEEAWLQRHGAS